MVSFYGSARPTEAAVACSKALTWHLLGKKTKTYATVELPWLTIFAPLKDVQSETMI
jgi:hypothetical protein